MSVWAELIKINPFKDWSKDDAKNASKLFWKLVDKIVFAPITAPEDALTKAKNAAVITLFGIFASVFPNMVGRGYSREVDMITNGLTIFGVSILSYGIVGGVRMVSNLVDDLRPKEDPYK